MNNRLTETLYTISFLNCYFLTVGSSRLSYYSKRVLRTSYFWKSCGFVAFLECLCVFGVTEAPSQHRRFLPSLPPAVAWLTECASAVMSWHLENSILLRNSDTCLLKEIIYTKSYFSNLTAATAVTATVTCTGLAERHAIFRLHESETT
jgi:hypothetical protein